MVNDSTRAAPSAVVGVVGAARMPCRRFADHDSVN
jgi:hypothetical protein